MYIIHDKVLVTCQIFYFLPDYKHILQEFVLQDVDVRPKYPRINKFLNFWRQEIEAEIKDILLMESEIIGHEYQYTSIEEYFRNR